MAHINGNFYSDVLQRNTALTIFLPGASADDHLNEKEIHYYDRETEFPVLYLLHGSYGGHTDWTVLSGIERYAQEKRIAVVMPMGENSYYADMEFGGNYLAYMTKELPDFVKTIFPVSKKREETYIAGLSMGGYGAFRCAFEHPENYGYAASLSGVLNIDVLKDPELPHMGKLPANYVRAIGIFENPENRLEVLLEKRLAEGKVLPKLYMTCGTEDFMHAANEWFYGRVKEQVDIKYEAFSGSHDWDYWDARIQDVLAWLP